MTIDAAKFTRFIANLFVKRKIVKNTVLFSCLFYLSACGSDIGEGNSPRSLNTIDTLMIKGQEKVGLFSTVTLTLPDLEEDQANTASSNLQWEVTGSDCAPTIISDESDTSFTFFGNQPGVCEIKVSLEQVGVSPLVNSFQVTFLPQQMDVSNCAAITLEQKELEQPCTTGSGAFGHWGRDEFGLPIYHYTLDQHNSSVGEWHSSESLAGMDEPRRDHFHIMGNKRLNMKVSNQGVVELFKNDRGPVYLNHFDPERGQLGGGFSVIQEKDNTWLSAYEFTGSTNRDERSFGSGYFISQSEQNNINVKHTIFAPEGDHSFVIDRITLSNTSEEEKSFRHFSVWDSNRFELKTQWLMNAFTQAAVRQSRRNLNKKFYQQMDWREVEVEGTEQEITLLTTEMSAKHPNRLPARKATAKKDYYPAPQFLVQLQGPAASYSLNDVQITEEGLAEIESDLLTAQSWPRDLGNAFEQKAVLGLGQDIVLQPGESIELSFAYGYLPEDKDWSMLKSFIDRPVQEIFAESQMAWKNKLARFHIPTLPQLFREMLWRTQQLQANTLYHHYYDKHYTPQGSAYLYLHGADGVPRDQSLYAAAMVYLDPQLAKSTLALLMNLTEVETGKKTYAFVGHGKLDNALGLHSEPSDLDLFFLFGVWQYLAVTGDVGFLQESYDYHPVGMGNAWKPENISNTSVAEHIKNAFLHLKHEVGLGPNGLIRLSDGDWDDGIALEDPIPTSIAKNERQIGRAHV